MSYVFWNFAIGAAVGAAFAVFAYFANKNNSYEEDNHHSNSSDPFSTRPICALCCEQIPQTDAILLSCKHLVHENCINNYKKKSSSCSCPVCGIIIHF